MSEYICVHEDMYEAGYRDGYKDAFEEYKDRIAELEDELDTYESDYTICDCCECLTPDPVDADGHTQCKSCTRIAALEDVAKALDDLLCALGDGDMWRYEEKAEEALKAAGFRGERE